MSNIVRLFVALYYVKQLFAHITCHDDPTYRPHPGTLKEVQFTWLGTLQYIGIKTGKPYYFRVPRVVLISKRFVLSMARDAQHVPEGFALGNVAFGEYERDEEECGTTKDDLEKGNVCYPAVLLVPIADVLIHPEFTNFQVKESVAILKLILPVKSSYLLPVCLPHLDYIHMQQSNILRNGMFYYIDFINAVPRDSEEPKEVKNLFVMSNEKCHEFDRRVNLTHDVREGCSPGCELRSGAPTILHEHTGHWTLVSMAPGGPSCPDPLLQMTTAPLPAPHLLIYPYINWILGAITGTNHHTLRNTDPFGYTMPRALEYREERETKGWVGRWWMGGKRCYDRGLPALNYFRFYHEVFKISPLPNNTFFNYYLQIESPSNITIVCVKVGVGYRLASPSVYELMTSKVRLHIELSPFVVAYNMEVEGWGVEIERMGQDDPGPDIFSSGE